MKKVIAVLALSTASVLAFGQAANTASGANAQGQQAAGAQAGAGQAAAPVKRQPQAKTQEEYKAYQEAAQKPDPASAEQAANDFATKFPQSELTPVLYQRVMSLYQGANNADKTIEVGRKVIQIDTNNAAAYVTVASVLANRTRDTDLDRDERLAEARKYANKALELLNAGEGIPAGTPPDKIAMYKDLVASMAYSALGTIDFNSKNYPAAEENLKKSVAPTTVQQDPISWLQLALTLDRESKYADALAAAQKCVEISANHPVNSYCTQERDRLQKLASSAPAAPKAATPAATPVAPQTSSSPQPK